MATENGVNVTYDGTEELLKSIQFLAGYQVLVGIPANSPRSGPISNAALAYVHEFGSPLKNIPARPFLVPAINRLHDKAVAMLRTAAEFSMDHKPGEAMNTFEALGMLAAAEVKKNLVAGGDPPFAPLKDATLAARRRRGNESQKALIDTAQMLAAITYVVRRK